MIADFVANGVAQLRMPVSILTPTETEARGCQLSLVFNVDTIKAQRIREQLAAADIVGDWREPNVLRIAPTPLYNTFMDAGTLLTALAGILA